MSTLWRWSVKTDDWEAITQAGPKMLRKVIARYRKHDKPGVKYKWTEGHKPKKFRARRK